MSDTIDKLKARHTVLTARIQKMEAAHKTRERKNETRRKILIGSYYLDQARQHGTYDELVKNMADFLTRKSDRALFGLSPVEIKKTDAIKTF